MQMLPTAAEKSAARRMWGPRWRTSSKRGWPSAPALVTPAASPSWAAAAGAAAPATPAASPSWAAAAALLLGAAGQPVPLPPRPPPPPLRVPLLGVVAGARASRRRLRRRRRLPRRWRRPRSQRPSKMLGTTTHPWPPVWARRRPWTSSQPLELRWTLRSEHGWRQTPLALRGSRRWLRQTLVLGRRRKRAGPARPLRFAFSAD
mmetsp:Transcript_105091/g.263235  ORF Transcript_105091/g.263235 Transcript_105091/m.263235 type:complete len:204 (+) Transcript_105091:1564-2175(+)